jgi:hypothetical protein
MYLLISSTVDNFYVLYFFFFYLLMKQFIFVTGLSIQKYLSFLLSVLSLYIYDFLFVCCPSFTAPHKILGLPNLIIVNKGRQMSPN